MKRILVVDDEETFVEFVGALLEDTGYRVHRAYDGCSALQIARNERPDLIITDIMMPLMDGLELCRELRADSGTRHIPVILMTAGRVPSCLPVNAIMLPKPFDLEALEKAVAHFLAGRANGDGRATDDSG